MADDFEYLYYPELKEFFDVKKLFMNKFSKELEMNSIYIHNTGYLAKYNAWEKKKWGKKDYDLFYYHLDNIAKECYHENLIILPRTNKCEYHKRKFTKVKRVFVILQ